MCGKTWTQEGRLLVVREEMVRYLVWDLVAPKSGGYGWG